jgi:hypothetical protein
LGCKLYHKIEYQGKQVSIPHMKAHVLVSLEKVGWNASWDYAGILKYAGIYCPASYIGIFRACGLVMHMTDSTELAIIISDRME